MLTPVTTPSVRVAHTARRATHQTGMALIELLVALTLLAVVLAMVSGISLRQQQFLRNVDANAASSARMREARAVLPLDLRGLSPADVRVSEARDTSLEVRATIGSAVVCDTSGADAILVPKTRDSLSYTSMVRNPERGDTAWLLDTSADSSVWSAAAIDSAFVVPVGACAAAVADLATASGARWSLRLRRDSARAPVTPGTALRITRPLRYTVYRGSDGESYLGAREWNPSLGRFDVVQPVAGPLAPGAAGLRFRYFDAAGLELAPTTAAVNRVALVQLVLHGAARIAQQRRAGVPRLQLSDSGAFFVRLRNAP